MESSGNIYFVYASRQLSNIFIVTWTLNVQFISSNSPSVCRKFSQLLVNQWNTSANRVKKEMHVLNCCFLLLCIIRTSFIKEHSLFVHDPSFYWPTYTFLDIISCSLFPLILFPPVCTLYFHSAISFVIFPIFFSFLWGVSLSLTPASFLRVLMQRWRWGRDGGGKLLSNPLPQRIGRSCSSKGMCLLEAILL